MGRCIAVALLGIGVLSLSCSRNLLSAQQAADTDGVAITAADPADPSELLELGRIGGIGGGDGDAVGVRGLLGGQKVAATGQRKNPDAQQGYGNTASHTAPLMLPVHGSPRSFGPTGGVSPGD